MDTLEAQLTPAQRVFQRTMEAAVPRADPLGGPAKDFTVAAGVGTIFIYSHREDRSFPECPDEFEGYPVQKTWIGEILAQFEPSGWMPPAGGTRGLITDLTSFLTVAVPEIPSETVQGA